ncbi:HAMP domain-containing protein [Halomonas sp. KO116]|uniref:HAMP domain-containing protein n=1 Tax=Halomonas sp. KO116 TaxID=1504981 RepID=UPI0004E32497|nr:HAMP domain-containing protein [Halomonas sp. KO116]AJY50228.1 histidine kinase HAMP region domain protein [Halomonas sp. KO116]
MRFEQVPSLLLWGVIAVLETALLVVAVVAWGVRNNVLRSLTSITRHSQRIAKGDLSAPV